jgi:hypothetical protein
MIKLKIIFKKHFIFAQILANELGVVVEAPTKTLWVKPDGTYTVGTFDFSNDGEMKLFYSRS